MYRNYSGEFHWTLLTQQAESSVPDDRLYLNPFISFEKSAIGSFLDWPSQLPFPGFSLVLHRPLLSHLRIYQNKHTHTRRTIGGIRERRMGFFRNSTQKNIRSKGNQFY
ncbi:hypothetical protein Zmor_014692 [Zophobas morio]|uniref:Uncharacterized protein n=1 Tax=Zophobas morio TaxID=2755281 RepID=A0AA38MH25_9CUCU|nr:hypothetical protein Zmor_014692 [Zophobas morio]